MDFERLIEAVRSRECLYNMANKKYSDHRHKELIWKEISQELDKPASVCKKAWISLRDSYRRAIKKYVSVSGEKAKHLKKWKYEEEMNFLKVHMKERECISSIDPPSDDEEDQDEDEIIQLDDSNMESETLDTPEPGPSSRAAKKRSYDEVGKKKRTTKETGASTASSTLMEYILSHKDDKPKELDSIDHFFLSMGETVKTFSPSLQHMAKSKVFQVISDLEYQHILDKNATTSSAATAAEYSYTTL